jgi:alpha-tubulin suppressor-like RCC1 family protein
MLISVRPLHAQSTVMVPLHNVAQVAAGNAYSCALTNQGGVKCWGFNGDGELGNTTLVDSTHPVDVLGLASGAVAITAWNTHVCALTNGQGGRCWGLGSQGQLGMGSFTGAVSSPQAVSNLDGLIASVSAGSRHTCAITLSGGAKCWGDNGNGQVGNGNLADRPSPTDVVGLSAGVLDISPGGSHTCALVVGGGVKCWGRNTEGQVGDGSGTQQLIPVDVSGLGIEVVAVGAGDRHACALTLGSAVKCWGANQNGQLGNGGGAQQLVPIDVLGLSAGVEAISVNHDSACALMADGVVKCWGDNSNGQLGDGTVVDRPAVVDVIGLGGEATAISMGYDHACALMADTGVRCWGSNIRGGLGDGTVLDSQVPVSVLVDGVRQITGISVGGNDDSLAATSDASGRFVAYQSKADNLEGTSTPGTSDIFLHDADGLTTVALSVNNDGTPLTGEATEPTLSADGMLAAFVADDSGIDNVLGETKAQTVKRTKGGGFSVLLRNLITQTTQRLSVPAQPGAAPQLAASGNAVVYAAPNPDPMQGVVGQMEVFKIPLVRVGDNFAPGASQCVSCKSRDNDGNAVGNSDGDSVAPTVSADGQWVAWQTTAKNLVADAPSPCPSASTEIMLRNLISGASQRIGAPPSAANCGAVGAGARKPRMDWPGGKVVFESEQPLKPGDANNAPDVYLFDLSTSRLTRVSETASGGDVVGASTAPTISGDGEVIAFVSGATELDVLEADQNGKVDVHVRSMQDGRIRRLSKTRSGGQANSDSRRPALNYNGTLLAFDSDASNLAPGAQTGIQNVFQRLNPLIVDVVFSASFE